MFRRSDVNTRVQLFREAQACIDITRQQGGFDGLPEYIHTYLDGMRPVGLDEEGTLVLPRFYNPEAGPPVLMLKPGENREHFKLKGNAREVRLAKSILAQIGKEYNITPQLLDEAVQTGAAAQVTSTPLNLSEQASGNVYGFGIPRSLHMRAGNHPAAIAPFFAHEVDHWGFYLKTATTIKNDGTLHSALRLRAIAEKRAYGVSHHVESRLGYYASSSAVESFIIEFPGTGSSQAINDYITNFGPEIGLNGTVSVSLAVMAISELFGRPEQEITDEEITAYQRLGVIPTI